MVSLLVPTMNRSAYIKRLFHYYASQDFNGIICIGDSSDPDQIKKNQNQVEKFQGKLNIIYQKYPNCHVAGCIERLLDIVTTPYVVLNPDDDFFVTNALDQCVEFLNTHPDYVAAHGTAIVVGLQAEDMPSCLTRDYYYRQPILESDSAAQRLVAHLQNYSVNLFSVHRVAPWREMYRGAEVIEDVAFASELLPCCLSVVQGKVKQLDVLSLVRGDHDQRYVQPDAYDWITKPSWYSSYHIFCERLSEMLILKDGIGKQEALRVVEEGFRHYFSRWVNEHFLITHRNSLPLWKRMIQHIPGTQKIYHRWRYQKQQSRYGIKALLKASNPDHAGFMPIYNALTKGFSNAVGN
jgi:glycosyltransferase domain-containing protein